MENLKYTFGQVNDWIKTADQKAMILGSFNMAGFIYQIVKFDKLKEEGICVMVLFAVSVSLTAGASFFWLRIIYPRLDNKHKKSKIFFQHIANAYEDDISLGIEDFQKITEEDFKKDLASQIVINSIIAKKKYANIQSFIWLFIAQLISLLFLFIALNNS